MHGPILARRDLPTHMEAVEELGGRLIDVVGRSSVVGLLRLWLHYRTGLNAQGRM